jgi:hypothetical protein
LPYLKGFSTGDYQEALALLLGNSTFATVRLRSKRSRNCGSRATTLAMIFKLLQKLEVVVSNVKFQDEEQVTNQSDRNAALPPYSRFDDNSRLNQGKFHWASPANQASGC